MSSPASAELLRPAHLRTRGGPHLATSRASHRTVGFTAQKETETAAILRALVVSARPSPALDLTNRRCRLTQSRGETNGAK